MTYFFYGTLRHRPLLQAVIGRDPGPLRAARLAGHRVCWLKGQNVPLIQVGEGVVQGVLFDPLPDDAPRLDAYENGFAYTPVAVRVDTANGPGDALVYYPDPSLRAGPPFKLEDWEARWADVAVPAATEFMRRWAAGQPLDRLETFFPGMEARAWASHLAKDGAPTTLRQPGPAVDLVAEHPGFDGFFRYRHIDVRHRKFDGGQSPVLNRECFVGFDAALVVPYDPATGNVLLIEQVRMATAVRGDPNHRVLEPVAGLIDAGEDPEEAVRREAVEEAGITLREVQLINRVYPSPGYSTEFFHCYVGTADLDGADKRIAGVDAEHEDIRSHVLPLDDALALVDSGEINVAPLAMMLLWLARNRERMTALS